MVAFYARVKQCLLDTASKQNRSDVSKRQSQGSCRNSDEDQAESILSAAPASSLVEVDDVDGLAVLCRATVQVVIYSPLDAHDEMSSAGIGVHACFWTLCDAGDRLTRIVISAHAR